MMMDKYIYTHLYILSATAILQPMSFYIPSYALIHQLVWHQISGYHQTSLSWSSHYPLKWVQSPLSSISGNGTGIFQHVNTETRLMHGMAYACWSVGKVIHYQDQRWDIMTRMQISRWWSLQMESTLYDVKSHDWKDGSVIDRSDPTSRASNTTVAAAPPPALRRHVRIRRYLFPDVTWQWIWWYRDSSLEEGNEGNLNYPSRTQCDSSRWWGSAPCASPVPSGKQPYYSTIPWRAGKGITQAL